jgi:hypothetical protein
MRTRAAAIFVLSLAFGLSAAPARAQYSVKGSSEGAVGERYHAELGGFFWDPTPDIVISSESLGIVGSDIDFVKDLGIAKTRFRQVRIVLKPGKKHKLRFEYTPITYDAVGQLTANVVFNGILFPVTFPVTTNLKWKAYRFGYEYDFVSNDRGFFGIVLEAKYTDVQATLSNSIATEFARARAPIPAIGATGRVYLAPKFSITGEFSGIKLPDGLSDNYRAKYFDFDVYGTVNFTEHVAAQVGYRSFDVLYKVKKDEGNLQLNGMYFGGIVRF